MSLRWASYREEIVTDDAKDDAGRICGPSVNAAHLGLEGGGRVVQTRLIGEMRERVALRGTATNSSSCLVRIAEGGLILNQWCGDHL